MFDVLIREMAVRFNLGDKALPLLQMLLARVAQKDTGGLPGFLERLKAAGMGPTIQTWLGGGPLAKAATHSQIENALGQTGGLLEEICARLDAPRDDVAGALGYLLPYVVGKLTPGGSMPASLPDEVQSLAEVGQTLLAAPLPASGGGSGKWLWPAVGAVAVALLGLSYCSKGAEAPAQAPAPAVAAPAQAPAEMPAETPAEMPETRPAPAEAAPAPEAAPVPDEQAQPAEDAKPAEDEKPAEDAKPAA